MKTIVGLYGDRSHARSAIAELVDAGFERKKISMVAADKEGKFKSYVDKHDGKARHEKSEVADAATDGAVAGGVIGGLAGLVLGLGIFVIPGLGAIAAAGPIVSALIGAGAGALSGSLLAALVEAGLPDDDAEVYAEGVRRGGTLVMLETSDARADEAADIMNNHDPIDIDERAAHWRSQGWTGYDEESEDDTVKETANGSERYAERERYADAEQEETIPVVEEELRVGKRAVRRGGVRVHTHVESEPVSKDVTLRDEEVVVERRAANRPAADTDLDTFEEGTIELTETDEEVVAEKQARVVEEVVVGKKVHERTETVSDTVRRTKVDIEDIDTEAYNRNAPEFERHYTETYANSGRRYEDYDPAYRYGYALGTDERYRGRDWNNDIERTAQADWDRRYGNETPFNNVKDAVRHGYNRAKRRS